MQKIVDTLQKFDRSNGWYYVAVPHKFSEKYRAKSNRGLIAITARVKEVKWILRSCQWVTAATSYPSPKRSAAHTVIEKVIP